MIVISQNFMKILIHVKNFRKKIKDGIKLYKMATINKIENEFKIEKIISIWVSRQILEIFRQNGYYIITCNFEL